MTLIVVAAAAFVFRFAAPEKWEQAKLALEPLAEKITAVFAVEES